MHIRNSWYVAAASDEIGADKPLGRRICGHAMVFFRGLEGRVAALEDFCPHRGAPLSLGFVRDGLLVCGYHGLAMGCEGKTAAMPGQRVGGFPAIRRFPAEERHGFIWVWPGDPAQAEPEKIPHFDWAADPDWAYGGGLYHIECDYRLMIDNLMDLTHETYVHATSIGQAEIEEAAPATKLEGEQVVTSRFMQAIDPPPFWKMALSAAGLPANGPCDRWQICRFSPPSHVMIEVGVAPVGKGGYHADPKDKASSWVVDFITPETDQTIWYFWGMARNFNPGDAALTAQIRDGQGRIFAEDRQMLERQQRNLSANPDRRLLMLNIDGGGVQARKIIDRLIERERAETAPVV